MAHALRTAPEECVGLLLGGDTVADFAPLTNVSPNARQGFELDPREVARVLSQSLPVIGLYHSHPGPSVWPSFQDKAQALPKDWHYWIVGQEFWLRSPPTNCSSSFVRH